MNRCEPDDGDDADDDVAALLQISVRARRPGESAPRLSHPNRLIQ